MAWKETGIYKSFRAFGYYLGKQALLKMVENEKSYNRLDYFDPLPARFIRDLVHISKDGRRKTSKIPRDRLLDAGCGRKLDT